MNNEEEKEFDKWFGHRDGKILRFAYASGVYQEVKDYINELLRKRDGEIKLLQIYKQKYDEACKEIEELRNDNYKLHEQRRSH